MQKIIVLIAILSLLPVHGFAQNEDQAVVASVRGEIITVADFQKRVRLERFTLINNINGAVQYYRNQGYCGEQISVYFAGQRPYATWIDELQNPDKMGLRVLQDAIDERIVRQEAKILGIAVSAEEVQALLVAHVGLLTTQDNVTLPNHAAYQQQGINQLFDDLQQNAGITESDFREHLKNTLFQQKLMGIVAKDELPQTQYIALGDWLKNLEARAGTKIQVFELWRNHVPVNSAFSWPLIEPVEAIPTSPPADVLSYASEITFDEIYRHPSGLFRVGVPLGWKAVSSVNQSNAAEIMLQNGEDQGIAQISIQHTDSEFTTAEALDGFYTPDILAASWVNYPCYQEVGRRYDHDKLVIDFRLHAPGRDFIARQISWAEGAWLNSIRIIEPKQRSDRLEYLQDNLVATFEFTGTD